MRKFKKRLFLEVIVLKYSPVITSSNRAENLVGEKTSH